MNSWSARAHELRATQARILADILLSIDADDPILDAYKTRYSGSPAGHEKKLRGIPVQARGIGGTIAHTNPMSALMSKQPNED